VIGNGWPMRLVPLPGELLSSCLARNAYAHGSTPYRFLNLFWEHDPVWNRDFDRAPAELSRRCQDGVTPVWPADIAAQLGATREVVADASLDAWRARLSGRRRQGGDTPLVLSAGVHHRTRTRHALQFCPDCIDDGTPYFRKEWRLGFVVACPRHGRALADACGHCDAPVAPHRSFTGRLIDCHSCGRAIGGAARAAPRAEVSEGALALQEGLLATLRDEMGGVAGPWADREVFDVVRCLLAASASADVSGRLRSAMALDARSASSGAARMRFEQCRLAVRSPWLTLIAAWIADWPDSFRVGAEAAGLTQRSFLRRSLPRSLRGEIDRLPAGIARDRTWKPVLDEPVLRRLRRTDPDAYRSTRAGRILAHCGYSA
jgi:hypothetical protein